MDFALETCLLQGPSCLCANVPDCAGKFLDSGRLGVHGGLPAALLLGGSGRCEAFEAAVLRVCVGRGVGIPVFNLDNITPRRPLGSPSTWSWLRDLALAGALAIVCCVEPSDKTLERYCRDSSIAELRCTQIIDMHNAMFQFMLAVDGARGAHGVLTFGSQGCRPFAARDTSTLGE